MIIKSFDEEIELLDKIELPNKLQLFSLYEDLYRFLVTSFEDDKLKLEYSDFFVNTFIDVLNNLAEDSNINNIMQEFIKKIKLNKYSNLTPLINYIDMFEFNLDEIIQMMTEASIIDDTNYPYKLKIILLEIFKNFTGAIIYNLDSFYDSDAVNLFGLKLMNKLKSNLESILSQDISYFKKNLLLEAKDILIDSFYNKDFDFFAFTSSISRDIIYALDDLDKEIFVKVMSDIIIDMDDSEFTERYNVLYFRNLASKYNISISEIINRIEAVSLKIKEFKIENPKLVI